MERSVFVPAVAYFKIRRSTVRPAQDVAQAGRCGLHSTFFGVHSDGQGTFTIQTDSDAWSESCSGGMLCRRSNRDSGDAPIDKVSPTIRTHGDGKIGAR